MLQRFFAAALFLCAGSFLFAPAPSSAAPESPSGAPTLFSVRGAPRSLAQGAQKIWSVKVDEDRAMDAVFKGGMWLPNGNGGRVYARYTRHILHPDGTWSWIGKVATAHGEQSAVITFGKGAVFGRIPQADGYPVRLVTEHGSVSMLQTSGAALSRSAMKAALRGTTDARPMPRQSGGQARNQAASGAQPQGASAAAASTDASTVIDVMVAYTPGFVSEIGGATAALTRINNLVDIANQAYIDSKVNQSIRLVNTVQVNYPDNTSNDSTLDDLTGYDSDGNKVPIPSSLKQLAGLRTEYGADLVSLLRKYDNATNGGCGLAWIIGGDESPIIPSQSYLYGYSVVGDGSDGGFFCLDTSFAHELGHNMGDAHDRANADSPGAYSYSYGYKSSSSTGFSTIMAYGDTGQTPLAYFSNPDISICQGQPCGVSDDSATSADNAHSMNNTAPLIAQFETRTVAGIYVHNDVNGDRKSDLFWYSQNLGQLTYWVMNGAKMSSWKGFTFPTGYKPVAYGDFNGDGRADILWDDGNNNVYMWVSNGSGFTSQLVTTHKPGSYVAGTGDVNHDGLTDIFWISPSAHQATYWLMSGATMLSWRGFSIPDDYKLVGTGDFNGNGRADLLWEDSANHVYMWLDNNGAFASHLVTTHQPGWIVAGVGDANGDGKSDIFWHNQSIGQMTYWLMDGSTMKSWRGFAINSIYSATGIGDFDGNGKADVLWTRPDRYLWVWLSDGSGAYNGYQIVHYSTNFVPVNY